VKGVERENRKSEALELELRSSGGIRQEGGSRRGEAKRQAPTSTEAQSSEEFECSGGLSAAEGYVRGRPKSSGRVVHGRPREEHP